MDREHRVFISSTKEDLGPYRQCVIDAVRKVGLEPVCMEDWPATGLTPRQKCREAVQSCARFVAVVAWMIGSRPEGETRSFTECEYDEAISYMPQGQEGIHVFAFLLDPDVPWPPRYIDPDKGPIEAFRKRLSQSHVRALFKSSEHLASEVRDALFDDIRPKKEEPVKADEAKTRVRSVFDPVRYFLGRKHQIKLAKEYLRDPDVGFVCVAGRAGSGKTALVSKICLDAERTQSPKEPKAQDQKGRKGIDGIVYLRCQDSPKPSLEQFFKDFGDLLGGKARDDLLEICNERSRSVADKTRVLIEAVGEREYVYAFDHLDELMDAKGVIMDPEIKELMETLLGTRHNIKLIASSRIRPSAKLPVKVIPLDEGLTDEDAVRLLRELDSDNSARLRDADPKMLAEVARKTEGLPRALQLFFGVLDEHPVGLSCQDLLNNDNLFGEFIIKVLLKQYYERLSEDEWRTTEALAVIKTPVKPQVVAAITRRRSPSVNVLDCLDRLLRRRSITIDESGDVVLQALDRQYVLPEMERRGKDHPLSLRSWHRHAADYYREARGPEDQRPRGPDRQPIFSEDDVKSILSEVDHRTHGEHFDDAARLIHTIDDNLFRWGHFRTIVSIREPLVNKPMSPQWVHKNLGRLGNVYRLLGRRDEAISRLKEAIEIAKGEGNQEGLGEWWTYLGDTYADAANFAEANNAYEAAIVIARASRDKRSEAASVGSIAILCRQTGRIQMAIDYYQQAIALDKELNDLDSLCKHTGNKACAYVARGDCAQAIRLFEEAEKLAIARNNTQSLAYLPMDKARAYLQLEDFKTAERLNRESLDFCKKTLEKRCTAYAAFGLGQAIHHQGNLQEAKGYYEQALGLDVPEVSHKAAANLGIVALAQGDSQKAAGLFEKAVGHCKTLIDDFPLFYEAVYHRAVAELGLGAKEAALETLKSALGICSAKGVLKEASQSLQLLKRAKPDLAGLEKAFQTLEAAANQPKGENRQK